MSGGVSRFANGVVDSCVSTNDLARAFGEAGLPTGTWVSARRQEEGRGRSGRQWVSREGNLLLSYLVRPRVLAHWSWVPLAAAVAACEAVEEFLPASSIAIKWPNDLLLPDPSGQGWSKAGGILCEGVVAGAASFIVVGIGVNCAFAPDGLDQPTSRIEGVSVDELRPAMVRRFDAWFARIDAQGPGALRAEFERRSVFAPGDALRWMSDGREEEGRFSGVGDAGELLVRGAGGDERRLYSEEVKLLPAPERS